jgi:hypothetical protein
MHQDREDFWLATLRRSVLPKQRFCEAEKKAVDCLPKRR